VIACATMVARAAEIDIVLPTVFIAYALGLFSGAIIHYMLTAEK
jgi:hypothetical protein